MHAGLMPKRPYKYRPLAYFYLPPRCFTHPPRDKPCVRAPRFACIKNWLKLLPLVVFSVRIRRAIFFFSFYFLFFFFFFFRFLSFLYVGDKAEFLIPE